MFLVFPYLSCTHHIFKDCEYLSHYLYTITRVSLTMQKIILDTNFLLLPSEFKVDIFAQIREVMNDPYKLYIIDKTLEELDSIIKNQRGKHKKAAQFALELIKKHDISSIDTSSDHHVDDQILNLIEKEPYIIATQDRELKQRIKEKSGKLLVLRQKKYLQLQE